MNGILIFAFLTVFLCFADLNASTSNPLDTKSSTSKPMKSDKVISERSLITSISSNPAAVNVGTGSGAIQHYIEKKLNIKVSFR